MCQVVVVAVMGLVLSCAYHTHSVTIIMIITLKGAIRVGFFLQSPHCAANCLQHVRSSGSGAIVCKSRATHPALITCNMQCATWYEGTAQLLSLTELKSHIFELHLH